MDGISEIGLLPRRARLSSFAGFMFDGFETRPLILTTLPETKGQPPSHLIIVKT